MDHHRTTTSTLVLPEVTTLDDDRTDRLGVFLAVEAAAQVAATRPSATPARPGRRILGGVAASVLLGGGLFAANAVLGGPGPARTPSAVAIERHDGWTTIEVLDPQADPATIEAELDAAGLDARIEEVDLTPDADGIVTIAGLVEYQPNGSEGSGLPAGVTWTTGSMGDGSYAVTTFGAASPGGLVGLGLTFPPVDAGLLDHGPVGPNGEVGYDVDPYLAALEERGIRTPADPGESTEVSIRDGSDVDVVLYVVP